MITHKWRITSDYYVLSMLINLYQYDYTRIENPRVGGSIPPRATIEKRSVSHIYLNIISIPSISIRLLACSDCLNNLFQHIFNYLFRQIEA